MINLIEKNFLEKYSNKIFIRMIFRINNNNNNINMYIIEINQSRSIP
jgi:hypothetical protein